MNNEFFGFRLTRWGGAVALMLVGAWFWLRHVLGHGLSGSPEAAIECDSARVRGNEQAAIILHFENRCTVGTLKNRMRLTYWLDSGQDFSETNDRTSG